MAGGGNGLLLLFELDGHCNCAIASGALAQLKALDLSNNKIGHKGMIAEM